MHSCSPMLKLLPAESQPLQWGAHVDMKYKGCISAYSLQDETIPLEQQPLNVKFVYCQIFQNVESDVTNLLENSWVNLAGTRASQLDPSWPRLFLAAL